jgi:hypothetical protein
MSARKQVQFSTLPCSPLSCPECNRQRFPIGLIPQLAAGHVVLDSRTSPDYELRRILGDRSHRDHWRRNAHLNKKNPLKDEFTAIVRTFGAEVLSEPAPSSPQPRTSARGASAARIGTSLAQGRTFLPPNRNFVRYKSGSFYVFGDKNAHSLLTQRYQVSPSCESSKSWQGGPVWTDGRVADQVLSRLEIQQRADRTAVAAV